MLGSTGSGQTPTYDVIVLGSLNADIGLELEARPEPGETVLATAQRLTPGGKGANQAVAAAAAGARVAMVGAVGDDPHADVVLDALRRAGVDVAAVAVEAAHPTGIAVVTVTPDGQNSIVVAAGANGTLEPDAAGAAVAGAPASVLLAQLEVPADTVEHVLRAARSRSALTVLNAAPAAPDLAGLLAVTDVLVVNAHEAAQLCEAGAAGAGAISAAQARALLPRLRALGPATVVITLGGAGAVAADEHGEHAVAAPAVPVVDTTGAGDAFCGAFAAALARQEPLPAALQAATAAGAEAVQWRGAQRPPSDEVLSRR